MFLHLYHQQASTKNKNAIFPTNFTWIVGRIYVVKEK